MPQESDLLLAALFLLLRLVDFRQHDTRLLGTYLSRTTRRRNPKAAGNPKAAAPQPLQLAWSPWTAGLPDDTESISRPVAPA